MAYCLNREVGLAIREGIIPVVLAGRFLERLTRRGFFWLPGIKYRLAGEEGDLDFLACCDGYLVFGECKDLSGSAQADDVWSAVLEQFFGTAEVAIRCGGHLVVLAAPVAAFPEPVVKTIQQRLDGKMAFLLLDGNDLERGHRIGDDNCFVGLGDIIPQPFRDAAKRRDGRRIDFGGFQFGE